MPKMKDVEKPAIELGHSSGDEAEEETAQKQDQPMRLARTQRDMAMGQVGSASERAQLSGVMQSGVGNTRMGQMLAANSHPVIQRQTKGSSPKKALSIATPLPKEATQKPTGEAVLISSGVSVVILPDKHSKKKLFVHGMQTDAVTKGNLSWSTPKNYDFDGDYITGFDEVMPPVLRIQTTYGPGSTAESKSTYGRGTTPEDIKAGKTSLGFHEGSHGLDYLQYVQDHPVPQFKGKVGMTVKAYKQAGTEYNQAMEQYNKELSDYSMQRTDCVGVKAGFCPD